jgi:RNA polymerase sigma-70 factor, ECF subfamily
MTSDASGDCPQDWNLWLRQHLPAMVLFARQWTLNQPDAEDAVQTAFAEFWPRQEQVDDVLAFIYFRIRRRSIDLTRRQKRRTQYEARQSPQLAGSNGSIELEGAQRAQMIEKAMQELPPEQREILVLKIWSDLSFAQIGTALNLSPNTAASRYRYALARLQESLAPAYFVRGSP